MASKSDEAIAAAAKAAAYAKRRNKDRAAKKPKADKTKQDAPQKPYEELNISEKWDLAHNAVVREEAAAGRRAEEALKNGDMRAWADALVEQSEFKAGINMLEDKKHLAKPGTKKSDRRRRNNREDPQ
jgi:hypothetical protein